MINKIIYNYNRRNEFERDVYQNALSLTVDLDANTILNINQLSSYVALPNRKLIVIENRTGSSLKIGFNGSVSSNYILLPNNEKFSLNASNTVNIYFFSTSGGKISIVQYS